MDKSKLHEKQPEVGSKANKLGDYNRWQRDMFMRSSLESDFSAQPYLSAMPLPYPLHLWSPPLFQNIAQTAMPQYPVHTHDQETLEKGQQAGTQTLPSDRSESPEIPSPNVGAGNHLRQSASSEPNHEDSQMGGARVPYNYPGGFVFPAPYPGQLDPLMLLHHMQRQMAYLYSISGCRNGYPRPTPIPSNGANQRGFIKIPSGIPQKHSRLWETQSTENMQLWSTVTQLCATVGRAEAEIFCQRGKISKLEDDLEVMKARHDAMSEALKGTTVTPQTKRVRRKRTATAPVAILGLPAYQPLPEKTQVKKARGLISECDIVKVSNYPASEERIEETHLDSSLGCTNKSMQDASITSDRRESQTDAPNKDRMEEQHADTNNACVVDEVSRQESPDSCIRSNITAEMTKETSAPQNVEIKQECSIEFTYEVGRCNEGGDCTGRNEEVCLIESTAKQSVHSGHCNTDSEIMKLGFEPSITENKAQKAVSTDCSMKSDWLEGMVGGDSPHASSGFERSNASNCGNEVCCASETMGMVPSQEEARNIIGASPDGLTVAKISDDLVLYPEPSVLKEPLI